MSGDDEDDVTRPLVRRRRRSAGSSENTTVLTFRVLSLSSLLLLVGVSIYFQWEVHELGVKLTQDESQIHSLQDVIHDQAKVIERFNNSVTNSDVMSRLHTLESKLSNTEKALKKDLKNTQIEINDRLQETLDELNNTVKEAEDEIQTEVETVKQNVEHYVRTTQDQFSMENSFMVYQLAGTFTLLSCLISMWHMTAHLRKYNQPVVQRKILAILWMSPIYAVTSWCSLVFPSAEGYLAIIKDFYEAYVIYQFLSFCIAVLGRGDREAVVDLLAQHADHLTPPFRLCGCFCKDPYESDRALADAVLMQCQRFAMQFVFLRPLTSIAMVALKKLDYYGRGTSSMDYRSPQFWIIGLQNISVFVAFTGLLKFYHATDKDLAWCNPFSKFLCIKGVVFMTFWQGLAIAILAETTDVAGNDAEEWGKSAQNFLICLEMLLFSIAHFYTFPTEEWEEGYQARHTESSFGDSIALNDFVQDLKLVLKRREKRKSKRKKKTPSEPTVPEEDEEEDESDEGDEEEGAAGLVVAASVASSGYTESCQSEEDALIEDYLQRGSDVGDDEIEEATRLLLSPHLKSKEINAIWDEDEEENGAQLKQEDEGERDVEQAESSSSRSEKSGESDEAQNNRSDPDEEGARNGPAGYGSTENDPEAAGSGDAPPTPQGTADNDEDPPNERSSLLGTRDNATNLSSLRSPNDEILHESIFTTVADIDTSSRMSFN